MNDERTCTLRREVGDHCKAVPLQAWSGTEGSRKLRFPDFMTTAQDGGNLKVCHLRCVEQMAIMGC